MPVACTNPTCGNRTKWGLLRDRSTFVDWQRVRVQENADEVPAGCLPRSIDVIMRHEAVESARAGDKCLFTGTLVAVPDTAALAAPGDRCARRRTPVLFGFFGGTGMGGGGRREGEVKRVCTHNSRPRLPFVPSAEARSGGAGRSQGGGEGVGGLKALGVRELTYKLCFIANSVASGAGAAGANTNIREDEETAATVEERFSAEENAEIRGMLQDPELYDKLVTSVAPAVHGHKDIKRAVLLMLFGGVHKRTHEGISLRGDINVLVVGDPSCAKSQFLKYVAGFLPRAVYTSGKSSSAAGLTATVAKEPEVFFFCPLLPPLPPPFSVEACRGARSPPPPPSSRTLTNNKKHGSKRVCRIDPPKIDGRVLPRGRRADAGGQRHLLHRRVRQNGRQGPGTG